MAARRKPPAASRLQAELARRILALLKDEDAAPGRHLIELDLARRFEVSRTPVRGALKLLEAEGAITARQGRGYVLARAIADGPPQEDQPDAEAAEEARLLAALAQAHDKAHDKARGAAREKARLPAQFTQQELARRFGARPASVLRVLRRLAGLGLAERKPGHGWALAADTARILNESYAFRRALEPQMLLQPGFRLDRAWADKARQAHQAFRAKPWRPGDGEAFHAVNADFHEQLARCSRNRYMLEAMQDQNTLRRFLSGQWDYPMEQVHSAIDDHLEILAALEAGYADKAAALMLHHLTQSATQSQKDDAAA